MQLHPPLDPSTDRAGVRAWLRQNGLPTLGVFIALLLWALSLPLVDPTRLGDLGLLDVLPPPFYAALFVLALSFSFAICQERFSRGVLFAHLVAFTVIVHATPTLAYDTLRYAWAWKHVGIIDFILRHGTVDRTIFDMDAYHNWPGFFSANALLTRAAGLSSALPFAGWGPVLFNLLNLGALLLLFRALLRRERQVWMALWLVAITSWVGQDYFSPQAFALFLHLIILSVAARWFVVPRPPKGHPTGEATTAGPEASRPWALPQRVTAPTVAAALLLLTCLGLALASSHQLTPIITVLSLGVLTLLSRNRALGLPALMGVVTAAWMVYGATPYFSDAARELVTSFGQLSGNIGGTLYNLAEFSREQRLVALSGRTLTLAVWSLAFVGIVRQLLKGRPDWPLILLTGTPFSLLLANSYGGEMIFRIYLFALPFMALWIAYLLGFGEPHPGWSRFAPTFGLSAVLLSGFLVAYYGKERQFYFSPEEVQAAEVLYNAAPRGSLIIEGTRNYPSRYRDYEFYTHVAISYEPPESQEELFADPEATLRRWMDNEAYTGAFLILTQSQRSEVDALGPIPRGALEAVEQALHASPDFEVFYRNDDAVIFMLSERPSEGQP